MSQRTLSRPLMLLAMVGVLAAGVLAIPPALAQETYTVNTTADVADPDPQDCVDDVPGECSLRAAVMAANDEAGSTIVLPEEATYELTLEGANEDDAATGDLDVHADTTVTGQGAGGTVVSAAGLEEVPDRVFHVVGNHTLTLEGVTVTDGEVVEVDGGAIYLEGGIETDAGPTLITDDVEVLGSSADRFGGGIAVDGSGAATLDLTDTRIAGNEAGDSGGGIAAMSTDLTIELDGVTIGGTEIEEIPEPESPELPDEANVAVSDEGGGIYVDSDAATLTAVDSAIVGNLADDAGGGLWLRAGIETTPSVDLAGTVLAGNVAGSQGGGGAMIQPALTESPMPAEAHLDDVDVARNLSDSFGGGVVQRGGTLTVEGSRVIANESGSTEGLTAGGLDLEGADLSITESQVNDNVGQGAGAVYVRGGLVAPEVFGGDVEVVDTTFAGNEAGFGTGGGLRVEEADDVPEEVTYDLDVTGSTFSDNVAEGGGGLMIDGYAASLVNTTISGNTADSAGGGVLVNLQADEDVELRHVTLAGNGLTEGASEVGGGIHVDSIQPAVADTVHLVSTIVADTTNAPNCFATDPTQLVSNGTNVDDDGSCVADPPSGGDQVVDEAGLEPLADNDGPTMTHALHPGSPAVDAAGAEPCPEVDQRGVERPQGDACDVGAFERDPQADLAVDKTAADDEIDLGGSTTFAVTVANGGPETATATTLVDTLPDGLELDEATASTGTCDADGATVTCELGDLADGDEVTVEVAVTGTAAGEQVNTAEASSETPDPDPDRASAQAAVTVLGGDADVTRLGGADRIATAIEVSQDGFADDSSDAVVLARAGLFPDALAGTPLAVELDAPLLLTFSDELDGRTEAEIERVLPETGTVVLLGGEEALSADVEDTLADDGHDVERYGGVDRFDTARIIAEEGLGSPDTTFLATGLEPADALTAGAVAGIENGAVVLTADEDVPAATQAYLDATPEATQYAAGGPAADAVPDADDAFVGATRFETAVELAEAFVDEPPVAGLATAFEFPDALTGGAHVSRQGGPMLLSSPDELDGPTEAYLQDQAAHVDTVFLYGGTAALSEDVATAAAAALGTP